MSSFSFTRNSTTNKVNTKTLNLSNNPKINNNKAALNNNNGNLDLSVLSLSGIPVTSSGNQLNYINSVSNGVGSANKALITDNSNNISNINSISCNQLIVNGNTITLSANNNNNSGSSDSNSPYLQKIKIGKVQNSKALVLDSSKNIETINKISVNELNLSNNNKIFNSSSQYINKIKIHPITLTSINSTFENNLIAVCWSSELLLAVAISNTGIGNRVITSPDGITWTIRNTPADNNWIAINWSAELSLFTVLANTGTNRVMTSPDGINWTLQNTNYYPTLIAIGQVNTSILTNNDRIYGFGTNTYGQIGNGNTTQQKIPVLVSSINNINKIEYSSLSGFFLLNDGTIKSIGYNINGELGIGNNTNQTSFQLISNLNNVINISASSSSSHILALLADNTVKAWGLNTSGQLGNNSTTNSNVPVTVSGLSNVIAIYTGFSHSLALLSDGTIKSWGSNGNGQLGNNSTTASSIPVTVSGISNAIAISAGNACSFALLNDGTIKSWGLNTSGQLGDTTLTQRLTPVTVSGINNAIAITSGSSHALALLSDNTIKIWGNNNDNQLGDNTLVNKSTPFILSGITNVKYIKSGFNQTFAILNDNTVVRWGYNNAGQLGNNSTSNITIPTGNFDYWSVNNSWTSLSWSPQLSLYVAVAKTGSNRIMTSTNSIVWMPRLGISNTNDWTSICWSPELNLFAAVANTGNTNRIMTSPDGITWTNYNNNWLFNWTSICWVPRVKLFIATSNSGIGSRIMTSNNGTTWTVQTSSYNSNLISIVDAPQLNMTIAIADSGPDRIMYTYNGSEWFVGVSNPNFPLNCIVWAKELNKFIISSSNTYNYSNITYANTNLITTTNWYNLFTFSKINVASSYTMVQSGSNPDVELKINSTANTSSLVSLWNNQRIQDATTFTINFEIKLSGTGDASSFNIGSDNYSLLGDGPNKPAFSIVFQMFSSARQIGIYFFDNNGIEINYYSYTLSENIWRPMQIIYNNSSTNTWQVYFNNVNIFNYSNPNHTNWITTSGGYFGFGSRNGGATHDISIRKFTLSGNLINTQTTTTINSKIFNSQTFTNSLELSNYGRVYNLLSNAENLFIHKIIGNTNMSKQYNFTPSQIIWISELNMFLMGNTTNNTIAYSSDGLHWLTTTTITGYTIKSLCWSPELKLIVAVSSAGTNNNVITSPDGINWTLRTNVPTNVVIGWYGICWSTSLNLFVTVGYGAASLTNRVMTSSDGITWTLRKSAAYNTAWSAICWSPELNMFVAMSSSGGYVGMYSYNGIDWSYISSVNGTASSVAFTSICWSPKLNLFSAISADRILISSDGINWYYRTVNNYGWQSICWADGLESFIAIANTTTNNLMYSTDGLTWIYESLSSITDCDLNAICWSNDLNIFTAVANNKVLNYPNKKYGPNSLNNNNNLSYFENYDQVNNIKLYDEWNYLNTGINNEWTSICYASDLNLLVAVSQTGTNNRIITSSDGGYTWITRANPVDNNWTSICYSTELTLFVAISNTGTNNRVMTSSDGITWTSRVSATNNNWTSICYSSELNLFIAVSNTGTNNRVMTSSDGITWTSRVSAADNDWTSICYSSELNLLVAVSSSGTNNRVMTSSNGITWTSRVSATDNNWTSVCWSYKLNLFVAISNSGTYNRVMISSDGIIWSTNNIIYNNVSSNNSLSMNSIYAGEKYSFAIRGDSNMINGWGTDTSNYSSSGLSNIPQVQANLYNVKKIVGSGNVLKVLLNDGKIQTRGYNTNGEIGHLQNKTNEFYRTPPYTVSNINNAIDIATGNNYTLVLLNDGTIKSWGTNTSGQLGNGNITTEYQPVSVLNITNAVSISGHTDSSHSLALLNNGTVKSWGINTNGQLGNGNNTNQSTPASVSNLTNVIAISAGGNHSLALLSDGTIKAWGLNSSGQLGNNSTTNSNIPVTVTDINNAIAISAGGEFSIALLNNGTIKIWGKNNYGQLGNGNTGTNQLIPILITTLNNIIAISAGSTHSLALLNNGQLRSWGRNNSGQLGNNKISTDSNIPVTVLNSTTVDDILLNTKIEKNITNSYANNNWTSICWSDEMKIFIAIANSGENNRIMVSNDGYKWYSKITNENNNLRSICWADLLSKFIIISSDGTNNLMYSNLGIPNLLSSVKSLGSNQIGGFNKGLTDIYINGKNGSEKVNITEDNNRNILRLSYNYSNTNSVDFTSSENPTYQINIVNNSNNKITNITNHNGTYGLSFNGLVPNITSNDLNKLKISTFGQAEASKALILDSNSNIININNITLNKLIVNNKIIFNSNDNSSSYLSNITPGIAESSKVLVIDSNKNIETLNKINSSTLYLNNFNNITSTLTKSNYNSTLNYLSDLAAPKFKYPTNLSFYSIIWVADLNLFIGVGKLYNYTTYSYDEKLTGFHINVSSDGINWKYVNSFPINTTYVFSLAYSPLLKMMVGFNNFNIHYSYNGYTWYTKSLSSSTFPSSIRSICWANGINLFVGLTDANTVMTSADGLNWTVRTAANTNAWQSICWSPELSLLVAISNTGTGNRVMTSPDGINWIARTSAADNSWRSVCWSSNLNLFVAVSTTGVGNRVMTSSNGIAWTIRSSAADNSWNSVIWVSNLSLFIAVATTSASNNCIMKSNNGTSWSTINTTNVNSNYYTISYSPELNLLVAGSDGSNSAYFYNKITTSSDSNVWTLQDTCYDIAWSDMLYISELSLFITISNSGNTYAKQYALSSNGIDWTFNKIVTSTTYSANFKSMAWSSSLSLLIVCCTGSNITTFYRTTNCISWIATTVPSGNWVDIKWIPELNAYFAVASGGTNRIIKSIDGITWTTISLPSIQNLYSIEYAQSLNMLITVSSGTPSIYFTSTDGGNNWTQRSVIINEINIALGGETVIVWISQLSKFFYYGTSDNTYYISSNGIDWTSQSLTYRYPSADYGISHTMPNITTGKPIWIPKFNKLFLLSTTINIVLLESTDGINWIPNYKIGHITPYTNLCWANPIETLIGYGNETAYVPGFPFLYLNQYLEPEKKYNLDSISKLNKFSNNQINNSINNWLSRTSAVDNDWTSICYSPELKLFVAVSNTGTNNRVMTSPDSITWTSRTSAVNNNWTSIAWSKELNLFAVVANSGTGNRVMTSPDGITWTSRTNPVDNDWTSICWANDLQLFITVSNTGTNNRIMISSNGIDWEIRTSPVDNNWTSICWSNELTLLVAVSNTGINNRIMTSYDSINWVVRTNPIDNNWTSVCWAPEKSLFTAVANTGTGNRIMTSPDGITWTSRTNPVDNNWTSICWAKNLESFIAVANSGTNDRIMVSNNGIDWISKNNNINNNLNSICWSNDYNLAVIISNSGTNNRVLTSTLSTPYLQNNYACSSNTLYINQNNGNIGLGKVNPNYQLELSTDSAGKPSTAYWTVSSDARLKENIEDADLDLCYNNVKNLRLAQYTWKDEIYQVNNNAMDNTMDNSIDNAIDNAIDNTTDNTTDNTIDNTIDNAIDNAIDNTTDNTIDNTTDNTIDNAIDNTMDNTMDNTIDNPAEIINNRTQLGWIADEVELLLPKSIRKIKAYNLEDCKTLDSDQIIASMYGTAKKLLNEHENQKNKITLLKDKIIQLENFINTLNITTE